MDMTFRPVQPDPRIRQSACCSDGRWDLVPPGLRAFTVGVHKNVTCP